MRNIFFPKMKKGTFYFPTSGGRSLEVYLPLQQNQVDRILNSVVYKSQFRTHMPRYSFCVPSTVFFSPVASGLVHFLIFIQRESKNI